MCSVGSVKPASHSDEFAVEVTLKRFLDRSVTGSLVEASGKTGLS